MATLIETDVEVIQVIFGKDADGNTTVHAQAISKDAAGQQVRRVSRDVTNQLTAAQLTSATNFMANLAARFKTLWEIS